MEEQIDLGHYFHAIRKYWKVVIAVPLISVVITYVVISYGTKPQYTASTSLIVNQQTANAQLEYQAVMTNQALVATYSDIIKSRTVESEVIQKLHLPYSVTQLDPMISVASPSSSEVIDITVQSGSPSASANIANEIASVFQTRASQIMDIQDVQIVDKAVVPASPNSPHKSKRMVAALLLGLIISIIVAIALDSIDARLRTEADVLRYTNLPVLGGVTNFDHKG